MKGIEYADKSWNPFTGCLNIENGKCSVGKRCWAYGMSLRLRGRCGYDVANPFKPTFHEDRLDIPLKRKKPTVWNCCFMGDIAYAEKHELRYILGIVEDCPQHTFLFLTKCPEVLAEKELTFPDNAWVGVTVNHQYDVWRIGNLKEIDAKNLWVSFEPLYSPILVSLRGIDWIVVGAQSNPPIQPKERWVKNIIKMADRHNIPVFTKPNLTVVEPRMELPESIRKVV